MSEAGTPPPDGGNHLLAAHYLPVMRLCLSRLHDPTDAEDATQEVFRRAVQHVDRLRDDPLPWLLTVARNVCNDELRRRRRCADVPVEASPLPAPDPTPEGVVVGRMAAIELLGRLTPGERRALATRLGASANGTATSTTRVLLARARQKLRHHLEESQSAFGTATVYGSEALHQLRARFLGRFALGSGRAAVLIPAVLMITVIGGPTSHGGPFDTTPPQLSPPALGPAVADGAASRRLPAEDRGDGLVVGDVARTAIHAVAPSAPTNAEPVPPIQGQWYTSMVGDDYRQVQTTDIEPSPTYATDHTVMMIGANHSCGTIQVCAQIFRSNDGGATWSFVTGQGIDGLSLSLPVDSFSAGHFYLATDLGIRMTTNDGASFSDVAPSVGSYVTTPPQWSGYDMLYSSTNGLWGIGHGGQSTLLSTYNPPGYGPSSPALEVQTPAGPAILQPVMPEPGDATAAHLERCTPTCGPPTNLPFTNAYVVLLASPDIATDHTVLASGGNMIAISHDDGQTFTTWNPTPVIVMNPIVVRGPHGRRLVAPIGPNPDLGYSDDDGITWHFATTPNPDFSQPHNVRQLRPGRLIASMTRSDDWGWYYFVCSTDGSDWRLCTPDRG